MALQALLPNSPEREPLSFERSPAPVQWRVVRLSNTRRSIEGLPEAAESNVVEHPAASTAFEPIAAARKLPETTPITPTVPNHANNAELMRDAYHKLEQIGA